MDNLKEIFSKKTELLRSKLTSDNFREYSPIDGKFAVFFSVSDINQQAYIFRAAADSAEAAFEQAKENALEFIGTENFVPAWVKADITQSGEKRPLSDVLAEEQNGKANFFRKGISFDSEFKMPLLECELNNFSLFDHKNGKLPIAKLDEYLAANDLPTLTQLPSEVTVFTCKSAFCDEKSEVCELYSEGNNCGRRVRGEFDKDAAQRVITTAAEFLAMQIGLDGKFDYGFYPTIPKKIAGYNILRHASSIWSLLCSYRITKDRFIMEQAENAIGFMIRNMSQKYPNAEGRDNVLYLFEETKREVKIGGNAIAIIVLTEYMNITGSDKFAKIAKELGFGILELFDERYGSFFHVLKFPSLAPRDKFRTVYYDGECVFALSRLYGLTKDKRFLEAAKMAVDRFINKEYEQYADHWVAYSVNELTKYAPEEKYLEFGLKNVASNLQKIHDTVTTYHTYLELLCVSFELADRIRSEKLKCRAFESFDMKALVNTVFYRADYMLNGYAYPEYAMYFVTPESSLGSFFIRHDNFRTRIDDVQHFCSAYYALYRNYEKLDKIRGAK